jgi:hypothetical protein
MEICQFVALNRAKIETRLINGGKLIVKLKIEINSIIFFYRKRLKGNGQVLKVFADAKSSDHFAAFVAFRKGSAG